MALRIEEGDNYLTPPVARRLTLFARGVRPDFTQETDKTPASLKEVSKLSQSQDIFVASQHEPLDDGRYDTWHGEDTNC